MAGLHAHQVPRPAFGVGAHHMQTAMSAPPQKAFAMAVGNGVIGNKYVHVLSEAACNPGPDPEED